MKYLIIGSILSVAGIFKTEFSKQEVPVQIIEFQTPLIITPSK